MSKASERLKETFITQTRGYIDISRKKDVWVQIGKEFNGNFKLRHDASNALAILELEIPYHGLIIKISESDTKPLKFEIPFYSLQDYDLLIAQEGTLDRFFRKMVKRKTETGFEDFDNKYLVKSNNSILTKKLVSESNAEKIVKYCIASISITVNKRSHQGIFISAVSRLIDKREDLTELVNLHRNFIDNFRMTRLIT